MHPDIERFGEAVDRDTGGLTIGHRRVEDTPADPEEDLSVMYLRAGQLYCTCPHRRQVCHSAPGGR